MSQREEKRTKTVRVDTTILEALQQRASECHILDPRQEFRLERYNELPSDAALVEAALIMYLNSVTISLYLCYLFISH